MTQQRGATSDVVAREKCAAWFDAVRTCVNCQESFTQRANLGTHNCAIHPGKHAHRDELGGYSCCGRRIGSEGCCRADHCEQLYGGELERVRKSPKQTFRKRSILCISDVEFSRLAGTPAGCDAYVCTDTWTSAGGGAWNVARVDFRRYNIARHALCRNYVIADRVHAYRKWQPTK